MRTEYRYMFRIYSMYRVIGFIAFMGFLFKIVFIGFNRSMISQARLGWRGAGVRVEGVAQSDVFVACLFQYSCRGLAGLSPATSSEGVRKLREPQPSNRPQGAGLRFRVGNCMSPSAI